MVLGGFSRQGCGFHIVSIGLRRISLDRTITGFSASGNLPMSNRVAQRLNRGKAGYGCSAANEEEIGCFRVIFHLEINVAGGLHHLTGADPLAMAGEGSEYCFELMFDFGDGLVARILSSATAIPFL